MQIEGSNWLFVGDLGLRKFIAQHVDRLDDIISHEVRINPLPVSDLLEMLGKRIRFYGESEDFFLLEAPNRAPKKFCLKTASFFRFKFLRTTWFFNRAQFTMLRPFLARAFYIVHNLGLHHI